MEASFSDTQYGQILAGLVRRVQAISTAKGFHFTVKPESVQVDPANPFTVNEADCPWFLIEPDLGGQRQWLPANQAEDTFPVLITGRLIAAGTDPFRKMGLAFNAYGDLEKALTHEPTSPFYPAAASLEMTMGGVAIDIRCQPIEPPPIPGFGDDQNVFVLMKVDVHYIRSYGSP